jgi:hypothetical protein
VSYFVLSFSVLFFVRWNVILIPVWTLFESNVMSRIRKKTNSFFLCFLSPTFSKTEITIYTKERFAKIPFYLLWIFRASACLRRAFVSSSLGSEKTGLALVRRWAACIRTPSPDVCRILSVQGMCPAWKSVFRLVRLGWPAARAAPGRCYPHLKTAPLSGLSAFCSAIRSESKYNSSINMFFLFDKTGYNPCESSWDFIRQAGSYPLRVKL